MGGEVAREIARAKAAEACVRVSLERDLRRIESLVPSYRDSGNQVVRQIWLDAVRQVLEDPQAEVYVGPDLLGSIALRLTSSAEIMQLRRNAEMERRKAEQAAKEGSAWGLFMPVPPPDEFPERSIIGEDHPPRSSPRGAS